MQVRQIETKKISDIVAEQMEEQIISGQYEPNEKLPSVRELCHMFNVGRSAVRDAITALKGKGLVYVKQGEGTFICPFDSAKLFNPNFNPDQRALEELYQVRKIIESGIVKVAALHCTDKDINMMMEAIETMKHAKEDNGWQSDYEFHLSIARSAGNKVLVQLMDFISAITKKTMVDFHKTISSDQKLMDQIIQQHIDVVEQLKQGEPEKAAQKMINHLSFVEKLMKRVVE